MAGKSTTKKLRRRASIDVVDAKVAVDLATAQTYSENVFLFVPNLIGTWPVMIIYHFSYWSIGYTRIILAILSLHYMSYHPKYCTLAYGISCLLDAADGHAARALGQTSKFGAVLDMVTDRWATQKQVRLIIADYYQMHNIISALLSIISIPWMDHVVPAAHHARFQ